MSALPGILTTNSVCVTKVQSPDDDDLTICSENAIHLDTPHLLIRNIPIREHVRNIIFGESPGAQTTYYRTIQNQSSKENVLHLGTTTSFASIDAMNITSSENYMDIDGINRESYVHLKTLNTLNIQTPVYNLYTDEIIDYTDNIILKNTSGRATSAISTSTDSVLKNYLHSLVNEAFADKTGNFSETVYIERQSHYEFNVENMGEYFTNTVITNKITTENVKLNNNTQPRLTVKSGSAINLDAPVIMINGENLDELIKQLTDENGLITISTTMNNFNQISFTLDLFEVDTYTTQFTYDIKFDLIPRDNTIINVDVTFQDDTFVFDPSITQFMKGTTYVFDNTANQHGHPLAFHNDTNRDTPTYLYMQNSSGFVVVQDFSEYDILYATDLNEDITVETTLKYIRTVESYKYIKLHVLNNYNDINYTTICEFSIFPNVAISSISDTATTTGHVGSNMIDGNANSYFQTEQISPFDVIIEFQSELPESFTATFINIWNNQGWKDVDMYVSSDGSDSSWTLVREIRSELSTSSFEDVPGRTTEIVVNLPSKETQVTIDVDSSDNTLYKVIIPIVDYKSLYFEQGNSVGFKSTTSIAIPTNSFAWSYWVKFDTGLCNCTRAYLGGPPNLFPYFFSETNETVVIRGDASAASLDTHDITLLKGSWYHICRTYTLPEGAAHSSTNVWKEAYYIDGQVIYNVDISPIGLRIPNFFNSYPYPPEDNTTLMHTTNTWEFDLYWNYARARTLRPNDNNHENTYVNAQISHFALWMDNYLTQEAVNELYNAGNGILQPPATSINLPTREIKYTFEVSVRNDNWVIIQHIMANGIEVTQNASFNGYNILFYPSSPNADQENVTYMFDNNIDTFTVWRDNPPAVGTQLFDLFFSEPITEFKVYWRSIAWKPGIKIYENDVVVYNDTSIPSGTTVTINGRNMNLQTYNFTNQFSYDAYTLYNIATHYYPFGDNNLTDLNGTNNLQFFHVQSDSLVYETGSTSLPYVSFPLAQPPVTISELLNLNNDVIYTNVSVDEFGNVSDFTFLQNFLYIDIPVLPKSIRINNITHGYSSATNHNFPSVEPDTYYNMYANVINTHTNTKISQLLLNSDVIIVSPITLTLSNDLTFNVVQYNITVTVVSTGQGFKYEFDPPVTSFKRGDIYVFDNTINSGVHPLNFHNTNNRDEPFIYQQDTDGFVTVNNFSDYDVLFAHCSFHANMGSIVNNNTLGISVINSSHPRQYYVTLTVSNFNGGGFSIDMTNPPTMTDAIYDKFENNRLYFTFSNDTTTVSNKNLYVKVIDNFNITAEVSQAYIFPSDHIPLFTNQSFTFTSINSYGYSFMLNSVPYNESSPLPNSIITVTPPAPFINGTINASIEFTNAYGFNRVYTLGSQTVTRPTAASQLKLAPYGYSGFTATYYKDGVNGNPIDTVVSVRLYYQKTTVVSRTNYEGYVNITLNTPVNLNVSSPNTIYSFIICTEYANYGFIDSEVFYSNQLEVSSVVSFILGESIKDLNNQTYSGISQTLTWRDTTISGGYQFTQNGYIINTNSFNNKYLTTNGSIRSFGRFELGAGDFTMAFVLSTKNLSTYRLTYGITPHDKINIHIRSDQINFYRLQTNSDLNESLFIHSEYMFLMFSYSKSLDNGRFTKYIVSYEGDVYFSPENLNTNKHNVGDPTFNASNTTNRLFTLATGGENPIRIFDMILLPGVYMTTDIVSNVATDPNFGMILDYLKRTYGFTPGEALPPSNIVQTSRTSTSITLSWSGNSNGSASLTNYVVHNVTTGHIVTIGTSTSYNWTQGLSPNTGYIFKVEKVTSNGNFMSDESSPLYTNVVASAPNAPTLVSVTDTSITIRWTPNSNGGDTFTKYVVNNGAQTHDITNINTTQYEWPNLNSSSSYTFSITKVTNTGSYASPTSDPFTTLFAQPEAPSAPTYSNIQTTSLTISWNENSHGDTTLSHYYVNRVELNNDNNILERQKPGQSTSYTWSGLTSYTLYRFTITKVTTYDGQTIEKTSAPSSQRTLYISPGPIINLHTSSITYDSITLGWDEGNSGSGEVVQYTVNRYQKTYYNTFVEPTVVDPLVNVSNGWTKILSLSSTTNWYPGTGHLNGYSGGEFLFIRGDKQIWLIASHSSVNGEYYKAFVSGVPEPGRLVTASSISPNSSYYSLWWNRSDVSFDPFIKLESKETMSTNLYANYTIVYCENSCNFQDVVPYLHSSGWYVYSRPTPILPDSSPLPSTPLDSKIVYPPTSTVYEWTANLLEETFYYFTVTKQTVLSDDTLTTPVESTEISVTTTPGPPLSPIISEKSKTDTSITVEWIENYHGEDTLQRYDLYIYNSAGSQIDLVNVGFDTQYVKPNLQSQTTYQFKVTKVTTLGNVSSSTIPITTIYTSPASPSAYVNSNEIYQTSVIVRWNHEDHGDATNVSYFVRYNLKDTYPNTTGDIETVNNLQSNTQYTLYVVKEATYSDGSSESIYSNPIPITTLKVSASPINHIYHTSIGTNSVDLSWYTTSNGNAVLYRYDVYYGIGNTNSVKQGTTSNALTIPSLQSNTTYSFTVTKVTDLGNVSTSSVIDVPTNRIMPLKPTITSVAIDSFDGTLYKIIVYFDIGDMGDGTLNSTDGITIHNQDFTVFNIGTLSGNSFIDIYQNPNTTQTLFIRKNTNLNNTISDNYPYTAPSPP